jgi:hypothetical protein
MCAMTCARLGLIVALGILSGCASYTPPPPTASSAPRTRCLANPGESDSLRPLFFLFCVESP